MGRRLTDRSVPRIRRPLISTLLVLCVQTAFTFSIDGAAPVPEHTEARLGHRHLIYAPVSDLPELAERTVAQRSSAQRVRIRTETQNGFAYLLFLNEVEGRFPLYGAGSMIIRRSLSDGAFSQVKVFLRSDERFFVRISPIDDEERVTLSVHAMGVTIHDGLILPFSMDTILQSRFSIVLEATKGIVRWSNLLTDVDPDATAAVRVMAERTREGLSTLPDAEDGAMDEHGNLVFIETLRLQDDLPGFNCSGFAKWVCDGLYGPLAGRYMSIAELKTKHLTSRGHRFSRPLEDERDPYFGLDWSRNLATTVAAARSSYRADVESADVRDVDGFRYLEDIGYEVEDLGLILFRLATAEPGHLYIGSVNTDFGSEPVLRQHVHIVVFFPYFDRTGRFHVDVMERNVETSLESLDRRYSGDFLHLVRVRADSRYEPPSIRESRIE